MSAPEVVVTADRVVAGPDPAATAARIEAVVTAHPAVVRLEGGPFGAVATHLPGRRIVGVRVGEPGEAVELAVALYLDHPLPDAAAALRREVAPLVPGSPVDITVTDVELRP